MEHEIIGRARLNINGMGYAMYEVSKDHEEKCIRIRRIRAWRKDLPFFGHQLPRYDDALHAERWAKINSQKAKPRPEYRWSVPVRSKSARWEGYKTTASRPNLTESISPRPMSERETGKVMSQTEIKRLLAEALGMEGDE